jgi:Uma2 family endonuclease
MNPTQLLELSAAPKAYLIPEEQPRPEENGDEQGERVMGARASQIAALMITLLTSYALPRKAGTVFTSECAYQVFPHAPKLTRRPDVSFVKRGRLPNNEVPDGIMVIRPDLTVEVVSLNDNAEEVETRLMDFVRVGVPLMWVIYPKTRCVRVLRQSGSHSQLQETDVLSGEDVLPGFTCKVAQLFAVE